MTNEELAALIQRGDTEKLPELWQGVELLSKKFAAKYARSITHNGTTGDEQTLFEDLHSCGYPALVAAVQTYKPDEGSAFSTWFIFYLRQQIYKFMGWRNRGAGDYLKTDLHNAAISLNEEINESGDERQDFIPDSTNSFEAVERKLYNAQLHAVLDDCLATLPQAEREAITGSYYDGLTLQEMANREGVTVETIRQRQAHGMHSLRRGKCTRALREFYYGSRDNMRSGRTRATASDSDIYSAGLSGGNSTERAALELATRNSK